MLELELINIEQHLLLLKLLQHGTTTLFYFVDLCVPQTFPQALPQKL